MAAAAVSADAPQRNDTILKVIAVDLLWRRTRRIERGGTICCRKRS
jgi:hypothetical protein